MSPGYQPNIAIHFAALLLLTLYTVTPVAAELPPACSDSCVTPYNQVLGRSPGGIVAYSNCSSRCVNPAANREGEVFTGLQWQCVEYARRWLLLNYGVVFADVDVAIDIWEKIDHYRNVEWEEKVVTTNHPNGSHTRPQRGDLLIYARVMFGGTGHVAVVTRVDSEAGLLEVAEQNFSNHPWPSDYARKIPLLRRGGSYWLLDPYLIGWKRSSVPLEEKKR